MSRRADVSWLRVLMTSVITVGFAGLTGCEVGREFREAATPAVRQGVSQVVNGLIDGLFAAIEVEPTTDSDGS